MNISVSGKDVTDELGENLQTIAGMRDRCEADAGFERGADVVGMSACEDEAAFAGKHLDILRSSCYVDNSKFELKSGSMGGLGLFLRKGFWKVFRPIADWMTHRQNNINAQIVHAMELEKRERDRQIEELKMAVEELKGGRR